MAWHKCLGIPSARKALGNPFAGVLINRQHLSPENYDSITLFNSILPPSALSPRALQILISDLAAHRLGQAQHCGEPICGFGNAEAPGQVAYLLVVARYGGRVDAR